MTLDPTDVNSSGATFNGEIVQEGIVPHASYGFLYDTKDPDINNSFKVVLGEGINSASFKVRIDTALVNGLEYSVRAFAVYSNKTVYGNIVKFVSKGTSKSAWSLEMSDVVMDGWFESHGFSDNVSGYILFQSSDMYSFNPEKKEIYKSVNFPFTGNSGTLFTGATVGAGHYLFSSINSYLYKLQSGTWSYQSNVPFKYGNFGGYYHGFSVSDSIFILSTYKSYMYNLQTNAWQAKSILPVGYTGWSVGGTEIKNKAYVMTTDKKIWEYNTNTDSWIMKTVYPGVFYDRIIAFSFNNKIYVGLSSHDYYVESNWLDKKFWIYDPVLNKWSRSHDFPAYVDSGDLFYFVIKSKLYVGDGRSGKYRIWKFDPSIN
jgi:hypothetical protein